MFLGSIGVFPWFSHGFPTLFLWKTTATTKRPPGTAEPAVPREAPSLSKYSKESTWCTLQSYTVEIHIIDIWYICICISCVCIYIYIYHIGFSEKFWDNPIPIINRFSDVEGRHCSLFRIMRVSIHQKLDALLKESFCSCRLQAAHFLDSAHKFEISGNMLFFVEYESHAAFILNTSILWVKDMWFHPQKATRVSVGCLIWTGKGISNLQKERNGFPGCEKDDVSSEISRFPRYSQHLWLEGGARRWFWEGIRWLNSSLRPLPRDSGREPSNSRWPEARKTWDLAYDKAKNLGFVCGFGWEKPRIVLKEKKTCLRWKKNLFKRRGGEFIQGGLEFIHQRLRI